MTRQPSATTIALNLAPMVDVMMCLLIFFLVTTRMAEREHRVIDLPLASESSDPTSSGADGRLVVNVLPAEPPGASTNTIAASSVATADGAVFVVRGQSHGPAELRAVLAAAHQVNPGLTCVIRGDRTLAFRHIETLLVACRQLGIKQVSFSSIGAERETRP